MKSQVVVFVKFLTVFIFADCTPVADGDSRDHLLSSVFWQRGIQSLRLPGFVFFLLPLCAPCAVHRFARLFLTCFSSLVAVNYMSDLPFPFAVKIYWGASACPRLGSGQPPPGLSWQLGLPHDAPLCFVKWCFLLLFLAFLILGSKCEARRWILDWIGILWIWKQGTLWHAN